MISVKRDVVKNADNKKLNRNSMSVFKKRKIFEFVVVILLIAISLYLGLLVTNMKSTITGYSILNDSVHLNVTIINAKPEAPTIIFPINVYTFNKVRFAWNEAYDINEDPLIYNIQVSESPTFESPILSVLVNKLTYEMPFDLDYKIYYFRVRGNDGTDYGTFSDIATFGIKSPDVIPNTTTINQTSTKSEQGGAAISFTDSDADGVFDPLDKCSNTTNGQIVDTQGCSCYQKDCNDYNSCTDDYCTLEDSTCRHFFNDTISCGLFTECPTDYCKEDRYYDFSTGYGNCMNGLCFDNSCSPNIIYESNICKEKMEIQKPKTGVEIPVDEEAYYVYEQTQEGYDEDKDGVPDYRDKCPHSIEKYVDKYGCNCEQKRCIDLDEKTMDMCYRGRCIFAIENSEEYNKTMQYLDADRKKPQASFNFIFPLLLFALAIFIIIVVFIPTRRNDEKKKEDIKKELEKTTTAQTNTNQRMP